MRYSFSLCALLLLVSSLAYSEPFFVKLPDGKTEVVKKVSLDDNVETLREYLSSFIELPKKLIHLTFNARVLDPRKELPLRDYGLEGGDTIFATIKHLCCIRCHPIDTVNWLLSAFVLCLTSALFFADQEVGSQDLCDCESLSVDND